MDAEAPPLLGLVRSLRHEEPTSLASLDFASGNSDENYTVTAEGGQSGLECGARRRSKRLDPRSCALPLPLRWAILGAMSRVIAVANQKGGVGKTTTVINLGAALAEMGLRVVLIDLDPQAALTAGAGLDPYKLSATMYDLLMSDGIRITDILRPVHGNLMLAPASVDLASADYAMARQADRAQRLAHRLKGQVEAVDFVLIDTPPSLGLLTVNALTAAGEVLIPVECHYLAMRGVRALLETIWLIHDRLQPNLRVLGLLPTLYQPDSRHCHQVVNDLRAVFKRRVFETAIPRDEALAEAPAARKTILAYRDDSPAAGAYRRLADEIMRTKPQ
jgi:chromosome partitioning protein